MLKERQYSWPKRQATIGEWDSCLSWQEQMISCGESGSGRSRRRRKRLPRGGEESIVSVAMNANHDSNQVWHSQCLHEDTLIIDWTKIVEEHWELGEFESTGYLERSETRAAAGIGTFHECCWGTVETLVLFLLFRAKSEGAVLPVIQVCEKGREQPCSSSPRVPRVTAGSVEWKKCKQLFLYFDDEFRSH